MPVNQAAPMLEHTLIDLLSDMRSRVKVTASLTERISLTRDIALFLLAFYSMHRGYDLFFILRSQILELPKSRGLIFNFQFGKTLRASSEAVVLLADRDCPAVFAFRAVTAYVSAAQRMGWDLTAGHLFHVFTTEGGWGNLPFPAARMTTALQAHLRTAGLPSHFTMHSFRVGGPFSKSLTGTAVDEIMKIGGWKTESVATYYIGPPLAKTCTVARENAARATRARSSCHCRLSFKTTSQHVRDRIDENAKKGRVRQPRA